MRVCERAGPVPRTLCVLVIGATGKKLECGADSPAARTLTPAVGDAGTCVFFKMTQSAAAPSKVTLVGEWISDAHLEARAAARRHVHVQPGLRRERLRRGLPATLCVCARGPDHACVRRRTRTLRT